MGDIDTKEDLLPQFLQCARPDQLNVDMSLNS